MDVMRLDGNAAAGMLFDVFGAEVTAARGKCASCGAVGALGAQHLYRAPRSPGGVLRCHACEATLMVLLRRGDSMRAAMPGVAWLDL